MSKYKTPNNDIDQSLIKHQKETKHQIDMDKTCQCHHNKQDLNMSTRARTRVSKYHINTRTRVSKYTTLMSPPSVTPTSNQQQKEEDQLAQSHPT